MFKYPLLPEPVCFALSDRFIQDSPKSKVFIFLKKDVSSPPNSVNTAIVDGMFMLRALIAKCSTYQALARHLLKESLKLTDHRLDICFDVYESPSDKDVERKVRGKENMHRIFSIKQANNADINYPTLKYPSFAEFSNVV